MINKTLIYLTFLYLFIFQNSYSEILVDNHGERFLTLGSSKEEVLEILGTPHKIDCIGGWWYNYEHITFNSSNRIEAYSNSKALKILIRPKNAKNK